MGSLHSPYPSPHHPSPAPDPLWHSSRSNGSCIFFPVLPFAASHHVPVLNPRDDQPGLHPDPVGLRVQLPTPVATSHSDGALRAAGTSSVSELGPAPLHLHGLTTHVVTTAEGEVVTGVDVEVVTGKEREAEAHALAQRRQQIAQGGSQSWHNPIGFTAHGLRGLRFKRSVLSSRSTRWWSNGLLPRHRTTWLQWRSGRRGRKAGREGTAWGRGRGSAGYVRAPMPTAPAAAASASATGASVVSQREAVAAADAAASASREAAVAASVAVSDAAPAGAAAADGVNGTRGVIRTTTHRSKASRAGSAGVETVPESPAGMKENEKEASLMAADPNPFTYDPSLPWGELSSPRHVKAP